MSDPRLQVIEGGGDIVAVLESALEQAKAGKLDGVIIVAIRPDNHNWAYGYRDDAAYPWPRLCTATADALQEMLRHGLVPL